MKQSACMPRAPRQVPQSLARNAMPPSCETYYFLSLSLSLSLGCFFICTRLINIYTEAEEEPITRSVGGRVHGSTCSAEVIALARARE